MGTKSSPTNRVTPINLDSDQDRWRAIVELIDAHQYTQVINQIKKAEISFRESKDVAVSNILAAAEQLCLICQQVHAEKARFDQASALARNRERELRRQLRSTIDVVRRYPAVQRSEQVEGEPVPPTTEIEIQPSLQQRLGDWFASLKKRRGEEHIESELPIESVDDVSSPTDDPEQDVETGIGLAEVTLEATDRALLQDVHELLLATSQSLPTVSSVEIEEGAEELSLPQTLSQETAISQLELSPQEAQILAMETAHLTPGIEQGQIRPDVPFLMVYTLGSFRVIQNDQPIAEWYGSKGKSIFKYMISRREQAVAKEVLMDIFWARADPDAARNNLNVAIYSLRKALRNTHVEFSHVLFQEDRYLLNPAMVIWLDFNAFSELFQEAGKIERSGQTEKAMQLYQTAELLYQGEFLAEDRYEDWLIPQREDLRDKYMTLLNRLSRYYYAADAFGICVNYCRQMLIADSCHEAAHRQLMRCYYRQGQIFLAMRQYHQCVEALRNELDMAPAEETKQLLEKIQHNEPV